MLLLVILAALTTGCGGGSDWKDTTREDSGQGVDTGGIQVTVSTTGNDPDGSYRVTVDDDGPSETVADGAEVTLEDVSAGTHEVLLSEVANNCRATDNNPRSVNVTAEETAEIAFQVDCVASNDTGDLQVNTETTGNMGPDDYTIVLNRGEQESQPIGLQTTRVIQGLKAQAHSVLIDNVPNNCDVAGNNPRQITIRPGATVETTFQVRCSAATGRLRVTTETTGPDTNENRYVVELDRRPSGPIGADDTVELTDLSVQDHIVGLTEVGNNCTVAGNNPRTVTVPSGNPATTTFQVTCVETDETGALRVSTTTANNETTAGYRLELDGAARRRNLGVTDSFTFNGLTAGDHLLRLTDLPENCTVNQDTQSSTADAITTNPISIRVPEQAEASAGFAITCSEETGPLQVSIDTQASLATAIDSNGYLLLLDDGAQSSTTATQDEIALDNVAAGDHTLRLTELANNCSIDTDETHPHPRPITIAEGGIPAEAAFSITCGGSAQVGNIEVTTNTSGQEQDRDTNGYILLIDGGAQSTVIGINEPTAVTLSGFLVGSHTLELTDLATNCTVSTTNLRTVTINAGSPGRADFRVACGPLAGTLEVRTVTAGLADAQDPDGYLVSVDAMVQDERLGNTGSTTISGLTPGTHAVELQDLAGDCSVTNGAGSRTVTIPDNGGNVTTFSITCEQQ